MINCQEQVYCSFSRNNPGVGNHFAQSKIPSPSVCRDHSWCAETSGFGSLHAGATWRARSAVESASAALGWDLRLSISNQLQEGADATGPGHTEQQASRAGWAAVGFLPVPVATGPQECCSSLYPTGLDFSPAYTIFTAAPRGQGFFSFNV